MIHGGTRDGTVCGKPVARRWWVDWPSKPRFFKLAHLVIRQEGARTPEKAGVTCPVCLRRASKRRG